MFKLFLDQTIRTFRDLLLPYRQPQFPIDGNVIAKGLTFWMDCRLESAIDAKNNIYAKSQHYITFLLCGNTNVWMVNDEDYLSMNGKKRDARCWVNTCNHDSCWYNDGIEKEVTRIYFDMADAVNKQLECNHIPPVPPVNMNDYCYLHSPTYMTVEHRRQKDDNYKRDIVAIKSLSFYEECLKKYS